MKHVFMYGKLKQDLTTEHYTFDKGSWIILFGTLENNDFLLIATNGITDGDSDRPFGKYSLSIKICDSQDHINLDTIRMENIRLFDVNEELSISDYEDKIILTSDIIFAFMKTVSKYFIYDCFVDDRSNMRNISTRVEYNKIFDSNKNMF